MRNIELKVALNNFKEIINILKNIRARFKGLMRQIDTYYNFKNARIKIREINNKKFFLIFYQRPDKYGSKISNIQILEINKLQVAPLKKLLKNIFSQKIIINKTRKVYLYKKTIIHLDNVSGLDKFLELETLVKKPNLQIAKNEHNFVKNLLNLDKYQKINKSYSDLA